MLGITHEKVLVDCDAELEEFLKTMDLLGPKLGPMVFQFPAFDRWKFPTQKHFLEVLAPFLEKLPRDRKFAACDTTDGLRRILYMARAVFNVTMEILEAAK